MQIIDKISFKIPKNKLGSKITIDNETYFMHGCAKIIGLLKPIRELKNSWEGYMCSLTHEEWKQMISEGRIVR